MLVYLKNLLYDPNSFANFVRAILFAVGSLPEVVDFGDASEPLYWIGKLLTIAAFAVRAPGLTPPASPSTKDIAASYK